MFLHLSVILSTGRRVSATHPWANTLHRQTPPWADTSLLAGVHTLTAQCMLGYGQQAGGTHPTGMHSCKFSNYGNQGIGILQTGRHVPFSAVKQI